MTRAQWKWHDIKEFCSKPEIMLVCAIVQFNLLPLIFLGGRAALLVALFELELVALQLFHNRCKRWSREESLRQWQLAKKEREWREFLESMRYNP
jgi:hypothetical protein